MTIFPFQKIIESHTYSNYKHFLIEKINELNLPESSDDELYELFTLWILKSRLLFPPILQKIILQ